MCVGLVGAFVLFGVERRWYVRACCYCMERMKYWISRHVYVSGWGGCREITNMFFSQKRGLPHFSTSTCQPQKYDVNSNGKSYRGNRPHNGGRPTGNQDNSV